MRHTKLAVRGLLLALALVATWSVAAPAQEIPQPIVRPCKHPCLNKVRFVPNRLDKLELHAGLLPLSSMDPGFETFTIELSNANGTIFTATLPPGAILTTNGGKRYSYRNPTARTAGGIYRVVVTQKKNAADGYRVDLIAYGDLSAATEADMSTFIAVGDDAFFDNSTWLARKDGWVVDFPP